VRGTELDGLQTTADLSDWLRRVVERLPVAPTPDDLDRIGREELALARALRDAVRTLFTDSTRDRALDADAAEILNRTIRTAPNWQELSVRPQPEAVTRTAAPGVTAALAAIAQQAVSLLASSDAETLRACAGPGCMLFYRKDHPRRAWCSPRCSNRARAARHYARRTSASTS
jgi:predicted RNA-binding Zn ribbon-like protein